MRTKEFKKDCKGVYTKLSHPHMAPEWKTLKARIEKWMDETRRTWGSAIFFLLEKGMEAIENERNGTTSR